MTVSFLFYEAKDDEEFRRLGGERAHGEDPRVRTIRVDVKHMDQKTGICDLRVRETGHNELLRGIPQDPHPELVWPENTPGTWHYLKS